MHFFILYHYMIIMNNIYIYLSMEYNTLSKHTLLFIDSIAYILIFISNEVISIKNDINNK